MDCPGDFDEQVSKLEKLEDAELAALRARIAELEGLLSRWEDEYFKRHHFDRGDFESVYNDTRAALAKQEGE